MIENLWQDTSFLPTVSDCRCVHLAPCSISEAHSHQLVNFIDEGRGDIIVITIDGSTDKLATVVRLKAMNDPSIIGLDMGCKIWFEVLNTYIGQIIGNCMCAEVILEHEDVPTLLSQLFISVMKPLLVNFSRHPCFCVVMVIEPELSTGLLLKSSRLGCLPNNKWREFFAPISICSKCICESLLVSFRS